jgi:2-desacetyl-2-hydroxyethyl bacteriochlorophyllide A dehydrogenase
MMKAALLYGRHDLRLEDRPVPDVGPGEVLIKVAYCGICGSDVHSFEGMQTNIHNRPPGPRLIGHEFSGIVAAVGAGVANCRPGDRVTCIPWATCGACYYCRRGLVNHCPNKQQVGGSMAEYCVAPATTVHVIPAEMSLQRAALAEPVSCCVWAVDLAGITSGSTVAIIGAGTMGLLLLELAKASGAARTVISEPHPARRAVAGTLGADLIVDPRETDLLAAVQGLTDGIGCDVALEAVGHPATIGEALRVVRRAGTVVIVGVSDPAARLEVSPFDIYLRELTIKGCFTRRLTFDRGLHWLTRLNLDPIITHVFALDDVNEAMECARTGKGAKVLLTPDGSHES